MAITFYWGSGSPPSWRVALALEHKALPYESKLLSFSAGEHKSKDFLAVNPRGKVPAIVDDGFALWESAAILEYLDQRYPDSGSPLFPRDAKAAAVVRRTVQEIDSYLAPAAQRLARQIFTKKPEERDAKEIADARSGLLAELGRLAAHLDGGGEGFLVNASSAADFALYPYLAIQRRGGQKETSLSIMGEVDARLVTWMSRIESLPYFDKTYPPHWR